MKSEGADQHARTRSCFEPLRFEDGTWVSLATVPGHCILVTFCVSLYMQEAGS